MQERMDAGLRKYVPEKTTINYAAYFAEVIKKTRNHVMRKKFMGCGMWNDNLERIDNQFRIRITEYEKFNRKLRNYLTVFWKYFTYIIWIDYSILNIVAANLLMMKGEINGIF